MRTETEHVDIACPHDHVWRVIGDVVHWPEWTPSIGQVVPLDGRELAPRRRYRILQPGTQAMVWTVTQLEPGVSFSWTTPRFGMCIEARHAITPVPAGSQVHLQLAFTGFPAGLVAWFARARHRRYLRMEALGLKARCESSWREAGAPGPGHGGAGM